MQKVAHFAVLFNSQKLEGYDSAHHAVLLIRYSSRVNQGTALVSVRRLSFLSSGASFPIALDAA